MSQIDGLEKIISLSWRHRVLFVSGVFNPSACVLRNVLASEERGYKTKAIVVMDEGLVRSRPALAHEIELWFAAHADVVELVAPPLVLPGGEQVKNSPEIPQQLLAVLEKHHIDRHSFVVAVGGGALLDVVGFVAAVAHRGCRHIRIPTTMLSQADSGVGVKNGINLFGKKNFVGTFSPPYAVIDDFDLLSTLPPREKRAGYVEAIKVACIRDRAFFDEIERERVQLSQFEPAAMQRLIRRCAELHMDHIANGGDPFELGSRRPLDFGHWVAHKLEQLSSFAISHGEAVAVGIAVDVIYSRNIGWLDSASAERVLSLMEALGFNLFAKELTSADNKGRLLVLNGLDEFREHLGGRLTITLLKSIGEGVETNEMSESGIIGSIRELEQR